MKIRQVVVTQQDQVEIQHLEIDETALRPQEVLIETECSFISAGTELANYTGISREAHIPGTWCSYPWKSGYANVGNVRAVGTAVTRAVVGQRVFTFGPHASAFIYNTSRLIASIPPAVPSDLAAASRMAQVAMTAAYATAPGVNLQVAIFGLGMVGNLAAQILRTMGHRVIGIDPSPVRRELALRCGIPSAIGGNQEEVLSQIRELTGGRMVNLAVDAVGHSAILLQCLDATADFGEVLLLGSPREPMQGDLTEVFRHVHNRYVTLKGGLEWRMPDYHQKDNEPSGLKKHETIMAWLQSGQLDLRTLITHHLPPEEIKTAYEGLRHRKDEYIGVVLDWTQ